MFHIIDDNPMLRELLECIISDASFLMHPIVMYLLVLVISTLNI